MRCVKCRSQMLDLVCWKCEDGVSWKLLFVSVFLLAAAIWFWGGN